MHKKPDFVNLNFRTDVVGLETICPPYPSKSHTPQWLKDTLPYVETVSHGDVRTVKEKMNKTVKSCPGINDYLDVGFIVPLWTDILVKYDCYSGLIDLEIPNKGFSYHKHSIDQFHLSPTGKGLSPYKDVINLHSPWRVDIDEGYSTYLLHPDWSITDKNFTILPGIVDHDKFGTLNIILKWNLLGRGEYLLERGMPLVLIIPFKRETITHSVTVNTNKQKEQLEKQTLSTFIRKYKRNFWSKK